MFFLLGLDGESGAIGTDVHENQAPPRASNSLVRGHRFSTDDPSGAPQVEAKRSQWNIVSNGLLHGLPMAGFGAYASMANTWLIFFYMPPEGRGTVLVPAAHVIGSINSGRLFDSTPSFLQ